MPDQQTHSSRHREQLALRVSEPFLVLQSLSCSISIPLESDVCPATKPNQRLNFYANRPGLLLKPAIQRRPPAMLCAGVNY